LKGIDMNNTYSESFRNAREAALMRGDATAYNAFDRLYREANAREAALMRGDVTAYNAFDRLYREALAQENLEATGKLCVFNNVMGA
jgi:hypothetical protein